MSVKSFQNLVIWQKSHHLTLSVYKVTKTFPDDEKFGLISQIRRSCSSICANIAEGYKKSDKEFLRYLYISQASLEETKYHLILSKDLGYISVNNFEDLRNFSNEVGMVLTGLIKSVRNNN